MDEIEICPPWWPDALWRMHHPINLPGGFHWPGPGPINLPPFLNEILVNLQIHTTSYLLQDQQAAEEVRLGAQQRLAAAVQQLGEQSGA